ncbi:universal stress protein [Streptomyces gilvus]|uniref:universal stress protein n=1 Tax=Streptomyces gilvus TaxID=2920937 RepID=UPI001F116E4B|nr:universal stress protein [Streptomyces sp. CME 23]MCH5671956.1 universal stress protein [Streptomyces sp. CME 23]
MPAPVTVGVDGSAESLAAAAWAAREAERRGRDLRLLHAWEWSPPPGQESTAGAVQRHLARRALRQAEEYVRETSPAMRLTDEQVEGPAVAALLRAAGRADLLVLGSRGLSGFTGFLVGSVALGVVARATRPVVLVRAGERAEDEHMPASDGSVSTRTRYRDVVLGVDADDPAEAAIGFAFEEARLRHARLRVVHARTARAAVDGPWDAVDREGLLADVLRPWREKYPDVQVAETVVPGRAQAVLIRAARPASLLVVGHRVAERPLGPYAGPVTHALLHHVGCPVAVVPHY